MQVIARRFSDDWVTSHGRRWWELIGHLAGKPGLQFLEVGSHEGRSACWWLDNILTDPTARLTCVDPWAYEPQREQLFDANIGRRRDQVRKCRCELRQVWLSDDTLDFAYIDGSHEAADVLLDALMTLPAMRLGGLILFDDYRWSGNRYHLPKAGIDAFLSLCDWRVEVVERSWQLGVRVKSQDRLPKIASAGCSPQGP